MEVEGRHNSMQTFERQVAGGFKRSSIPERRANLAVDENAEPLGVADQPHFLMRWPPTPITKFRGTRDQQCRWPFAIFNPTG